MGRYIPVEPLTEENLRELPGAKSDTTKGSTYTERLPINPVERAKRRIWDYLHRMKVHLDNGDRVWEAEDVYVVEGFTVEYRGSGMSVYDLQDPSFWETKLQYLKDKYEASIILSIAEYRVYWAIQLLLSYGREGRKVLAAYELKLSSRRRVIYRGDAKPGPDLKDPAYWNAQCEYLDNIAYEIRLSRLPPRDFSPCRSMSTKGKARFKLRQRERVSRKRCDRKLKKTEAWSYHAQCAGISSSASSTQCLSECFHEDSIANSFGHRDYTPPSTRWQMAKLGVYSRMIDLWYLGGEGRETIKNDELRIVGVNDVRFRRSRGPKPKLQDPRYWEAKLEYFTTKYTNILRTMYREDAPSPPQIPLSYHLEWFFKHKPMVPDAEEISSTDSILPSRVESVWLRSEQVQAEQTKQYKDRLYDVLSHYFFTKGDGRHYIERDDIYVAGRYDIRYRPAVGPTLSLGDPRFWYKKLCYFEDKIRQYTGTQKQALLPAKLPSILSSCQPVESIFDEGSTRPRRTTPDSLSWNLEKDAAVTQIFIRNQRTPSPGPSGLQATSLSRGTKRKLDENSSDTSDKENQIPSPPEKQIRLEMEQSAQTIKRGAGYTVPASQNTDLPSANKRKRDDFLDGVIELSTSRPEKRSKLEMESSEQPLPNGTKGTETVLPSTDLPRVTKRKRDSLSEDMGEPQTLHPAKRRKSETNFSAQTPRGDIERVVSTPQKTESSRASKRKRESCSEDGTEPCIPRPEKRSKLGAEPSTHTSTKGTERTGSPLPSMNMPKPAQKGQYSISDDEKEDQASCPEKRGRPKTRQPASWIRKRDTKSAPPTLQNTDLFRVTGRKRDSLFDDDRGEPYTQIHTPRPEKWDHLGSRPTSWARRDMRHSVTLELP